MEVESSCAVQINVKKRPSNLKMFQLERKKLSLCQDLMTPLHKHAKSRGKGEKLEKKKRIRVPSKFGDQSYAELLHKQRLFTHGVNGCVEMALEAAVFGANVAYPSTNLKLHNFHFAK